MPTLCANPRRGVGGRSRRRAVVSAGLLLGGLVACNPWRDIHEAELVWHDVDRIESELGVTLTPLSASAPIGPWPRIVLRADRIDVDNRAWFLSLPDAYFLAPDASFAELSEPLRIHEGVVSLQQGRLAPEDLHGWLVPALYEALLEQSTIARSIGAAVDQAPLFGGHLTVVAEPDIPLATLTPVLSSAGQALFSSWMLAGKAGDRLEAAVAGPPLLADDPDLMLRLWELQGGCRLRCRVHLGSGRERAVCGELPPFAAQPGCAGEHELMDALAVLSDRCAARWEALAPEPPSVTPVPPTHDCIQLQLQDDGLTYQHLVDEMAAVAVHYPKLRQPYLHSPPVGDLPLAARADACAVALLPDALTEAQLDVICHSTGRMRVPKWTASAGTSPDPAPPPSGGLALPQGYDEAFPDYAEWYAAQVEAVPAIDKDVP